MDPFLLMVLVIVVAVVFEYINGFHDAANAIATVVSTRVLTPRQAIMLAAVTNLVGAFWGTAVAKTIYSGYIDMAGGHIAIEGMQLAIACGLMGGIVWNLITWWFGIPSSSSHALIGGLCGGVLGLTHLNWHSLIWSGTDAAGKAIGLWPKLIKPMVISPFIGFTLGVIFMALLTMLIVRLSIRPSIVSKVFGKLQLISAGMMGFSHGSNDAQKTVGIITFALIVGVGAGAFDRLQGLVFVLDFFDVREFAQFADEAGRDFGGLLEHAHLLVDDVDRELRGADGEAFADFLAGLRNLIEGVGQGFDVLALERGHEGLAEFLGDGEADAFVDASGHDEFGEALLEVRLADLRIELRERLRALLGLVGAGFEELVELFILTEDLLEEVFHGVWGTKVERRKGEGVQVPSVTYL